MNKKNTFRALMLGALSFIGLACQDAEYPVLDNMLYISDTSVGRVKTVSLEEGETKASVLIRLAQASDKDVKVNVAIDPEWLEEYNKCFDASFLCVDENFLSYESEFTIPAGSVSNSPLLIRIAAFETNGAQYAIPIRITSSDIEINEASSKFIIALMKPLKQLVPSLGWRNGIEIKDSGFPIELPNYTLECWTKMSGFSVNNQAIFNCGSPSTELYARFGDLVYNNAGGSGYLYNFFQIKTMGAQFDTGDPNDGSYALSPNTWYHLAISYDGATGKSILYKNGVEMANLSTGPGRNMISEAFQMVCSGQQYFWDRIEMCQVRFWSTTRTQAQIQKNMNSEVRYDDPDLVLYLPMNEGSGSVIHDVTGHGHDGYFGTAPLLNGNGSASGVTWAEYEFR